jgi:hypothetical protein
MRCRTRPTKPGLPLLPESDPQIEARDRRQDRRCSSNAAAAPLRSAQVHLPQGASQRMIELDARAFAAVDCASRRCGRRCGLPKPRLPGGAVSETSGRAEIQLAADPIPWTARATSRTTIDSDTAISTDPTATNNSPTANSGRLPTESTARPSGSESRAIGTAYAASANPRAASPLRSAARYPGAAERPGREAANRWSPRRPRSR